MALILLSLFIIVPIVEIALFIQVGEAIHLWPTLGLVVLTAVIGAALVRQQGLAVMARLRGDLDRGLMPADALVDGAMILVAGLLLLTPGFLTDSLGFLLLFPPVRGLLKLYLASRVAVMAAQRGPRRNAQDPGVIEGEYEEINDDPPDPKS